MLLMLAENGPRTNGACFDGEDVLAVDMFVGGVTFATTGDFVGAVRGARVTVGGILHPCPC